MEKSSTVYTTEHLIFKNFTTEDMTDEYYSWFHDTEVTAHNSHGLFPYTKKQKSEFLNSIDNKERIVFAVYTRNRARVGNVELASFDWINRSAEISIVVGARQEWGKGYGTEMCKKVVEHGFLNLNLHRIWTGTTETNIGMNFVAKKIGMSYEGKFKKAKFLNGEYVDINLYGLTVDDWKNPTVEKALENTDDILSLVEDHRGANNKLWMGLVKIATKTKEGINLLKDIRKNDVKISNLLGEITEEEKNINEK